MRRVMCCEKIALERTTVSLLQRKAYMLINGVIALFLRCFFYNSFLYTVFHQAILLYDYVSWFVEKEVADKEACGYCPFIRDRKKVFCCSDKRSITNFTKNYKTYISVEMCNENASFNSSI